MFDKIVISKDKFEEIKNKLEKGLTYSALDLVNEETNDMIRIIPYKINNKYLYFVPNWYDKRDIEIDIDEYITEKEFQQLCEKMIDLDNEIYFRLQDIRKKMKNKDDYEFIIKMTTKE